MIIFTNGFGVFRFIDRIPTGTSSVEPTLAANQVPIAANPCALSAVETIYFLGKSASGCADIL